MNSRQRFQTICSHQAADRAPIDYLAHPAVDLKLKQYLRLETEEELLSALGCDFYYLSCKDISQNECCMPFYKGPRLDISGSERTCPLGIRFKREAFADKFAVDEAIAGPLNNATEPGDILKHQWPKASWFDFSPLLDEIQMHKDRVLISGLWTGILGDAYRLMGFQNFLMNIALNPELIKTLVNRLTDVYLELNDSIFSLLKGRLDIWFFGNDFGSQENLLFSKAHFREIFFGNISRLCSLAHSYQMKVMMHSCGAVSRLIPDLIEAGVDIIDPVQVSAKGMNIAELKSEFGDRIIFHGGIDTQQILPKADAETVRRHCLKTLDILGQDGGYIFAPSQLLQQDIPVENIIQMYKTARETKTIKPRR